jgi:hypothetical protein
MVSAPALSASSDCISAATMSARCCACVLSSACHSAQAVSSAPSSTWFGSIGLLGSPEAHLVLMDSTSTRNSGVPGTGATVGTPSYWMYRRTSSAEPLIDWSA